MQVFCLRPHSVSVSAEYQAVIFAEYSVSAESRLVISATHSASAESKFPHAVDFYSIARLVLRATSENESERETRQGGAKIAELS